MNLPQIDMDCTGETPWIHLNGKTLSLTALAAISPSMVAVLEQLAKPEANGGVFRVERNGEHVRLIRVGLMGHAMHKVRR